MRGRGLADASFVAQHQRPLQQRDRLAVDRASFGVRHLVSPNAGFAGNVPRFAESLLDLDRFKLNQLEP